VERPDGTRTTASVRWPRAAVGTPHDGGSG
jgi:hypothetical protein